MDATGDLTATEHSCGQDLGPPKLAPRLAWHEPAGQHAPALSPHFISPAGRRARSWRFGLKLLRLIGFKKKRERSTWPYSRWASSAACSANSQWYLASLCCYWCSHHPWLMWEFWVNRQVHLSSLVKMGLTGTPNVITEDLVVQNYYVIATNFSLCKDECYFPLGFP